MLEIVKYFKPDRFPIVIIIGLIIYFIVAQNNNPYNDQVSKIEVLNSIKENTSDTDLIKQIDAEYLEIINSLDEKKEIEFSWIIWYFIVALFICLFITIWGFIAAKKAEKEKKGNTFGGYLLGIISLILPVAILSFVFNFYVIDNHYITLSIAAILTFVLMRLHSSNKKEND